MKGEDRDRFDRLVMPDYRVLHDKFTDIVIGQMNYFDELDKVDIASLTYTEIMSMKDQADKRYQNDYVFNARVKSVVAMLMQATQEERDNRIAGLPFERFRIVEV
jgi:hypothetical protein